MSDVITKLDQIIEKSLRLLAKDIHVQGWYGKENDWVNYFAHKYLLPQRSNRGPLRDAGQICIEVSIPQPPSRIYLKPSVRRDLVIWPKCGDVAFDAQWVPCKHPLAILEWTVLRPKRKKKKRIFEKERKWLRDYCRWQPSVLGYAILVDAACIPKNLQCSRFLGPTKDDQWLNLPFGSGSE